MSDRPKRLTRKTAARLVTEASDRILSINNDGLWPWCIDRAVLFGSFVNTDNDRLGDLDLALHIIPRYEGEMQKARYRDLYEAVVAVHPYLATLGGVDCERVVTMRRTIQVVRGGSKFISVHRIGVDDDAIFSGITEDLCVGPIRRFMA